MKVTYKVTEEDYTKLLAGLIRKRDRRPAQRVMFFLLTAGQIAVVAWLCIFRLAPGQRLFYIVWSLLLAGFTVLRRCTAHSRAKGTLLRLKDNGQLPADYWEEHTLSETREGLVLTYGNACTVCPKGAFSGVSLEDGLYYVRAGENIFDIIPETAFPSEKEKQEFLKALQEFREKRPEGEEMIAGDGHTESGNGTEAGSALTFPLTGDAFVRLQAQAFRTVYVRWQLTERMSLFKIAASVFLCIIAILNFSWGTAALAAALILLLNRNHLMVLTPLLTLRVKKELGPFAEGGTYSLSAEEKGFCLSLASNRLFIPYDRIDAAEDFRYGRLYSWGRLPAAVIPADFLSEPSGRAFLERAESLRRAAKYGRPAKDV